MVRSCLFICLVIVSGVFLGGCSNSTPVTTPGPNTSPNSSASSPTNQHQATTKAWDDYPDVPKVEIMTEVDGIKIPREKLTSETLQLTGPIPADVGNEHASKKASSPVTGDTLTMRFQTEPKVLNPITETSAVKTYIMQYVNEGLARQNPETFEFEPGLAKKWVVEDSIKLSADFSGRERRVAIAEGIAQASLEFDYVVSPPLADKPAQGPTIRLKTSDKDGHPVGNVWVGIFPVKKIPGAPMTGYHFWTNSKGLLEISGTPFPAGQYRIKTGDEVFGDSLLQEDGSVRVTPMTAENPLREALVLKAGEWQDIQAKTYTTYYLREDAKWSDGVPFTSKDVEFGYALLNSEFVDGDSIRTYYSDVVECTSFGPYTVRLRYRQQYFLAAQFSHDIASYTPPFHFFENIFRSQGRELTLERLTPEEEEAKKQISARGQEFGKFFNTDERYNSRPLGTGPYIIEKWDRTNQVELVRNPNYWEPSKAGHLDHIVFKFIPDQVTAFAAFKAGELDFFYDMSTEQYFDDWNSLSHQVRETYVKGSWFVPMYQWVGWNQLATPLKDRRVRIALTMLFDRQDFIKKKLHGAAVVVTGPEYLFGPAYDSEVTPIAYDPDTARELLTEAGWIDSDNDGILDRNGEKFQVLLRIPQGKPIYTQICEVMQKNFKNVGIDLQIQTMEWASFVDKLRSKECDAMMLRWSMSPEGDPFQVWHSSGAPREKRGSNSISFSNQKADELIELQRVTLDPKKRHLIQYAFHRVIDSEQPYTFLWTPKEFGAYHKRFRNVKWYRLRPGFDLTEWYVPKDEQIHK